MKSRILSIIITLIIFLNLISTNVSAQELNTDLLIDIHNEAPSNVYKVVVPTNYRFTVDPFEVLNNGSMIASPEFCLINKSSVPVNVDMSFRLSAEDGVVLDIKNSRDMVNKKLFDNDIWLAVAFNSNIKREIKRDELLKTDRGEIIYQYSDGLGTTPTKYIYIEKDSIVPNSSIDTSNELPKEQDISNTQKPIEITESKQSQIAVEEVSGSAISANKNEVDPILDAGQIELMSINDIENKFEVTVKEVSGSAITIPNNESSSIENKEQINGTANEASGSAITIPNNESSSIENKEQINGTANEASGSAITIPYNGVDSVKNNNKIDGTATETIDSAITNPTDENLASTDKVEKENTESTSEPGDTIPVEKDKLSKEKKEVVKKVITKVLVYGTPIHYKNTVRIFGEYGDLDKLNEKSPNVLTISNEWNTKSIELDKATVYKLPDGTTATGEIAENTGVATFRFIGKVNTKIDWSNTHLKATIRYTINAPQRFERDSEKVNENKDEKDTLIGSNSLTSDYLAVNKVIMSLNHNKEQLDYCMLTNTKDIIQSDIQNIRTETINSC